MALAMENIKKEYQMKKLILLILMLAVFKTCKAQDKTFTDYKKEKMEHLNLDTWNKGNYTDDEGNLIQQFQTQSTGSDYIQKIKLKNSPIEYLKQFYSNKNLRYKTTFFYSFPIDITEEYKENGAILKVTDHDKNYPFKTRDLCKLVKSEYGIDLMIPSNPNKDEVQYRVERKYDDSAKKYIYLVIFTYGYSEEGEGGYPSKIVSIDGSSGKILYEDSKNLNKQNADQIPKSTSEIPEKKNQK